MDKVFLHNEYVDTLGVIVKVGAKVVIRFMGRKVKAKIIEVLPDGVIVETLEEKSENTNT